MKTFSANALVTVIGALFLTAASAEASPYGDTEVSIRADIHGQLCGLEWSSHAGGNSAVGPQEHLAKFDCNNPDGDPMFLESGTRKVYTVRQGSKCYLEWAAAKQTAPGIWEHERVAKFDCGGGADTVLIYGQRGGKQYISAWLNGEDRMCHFQWNGRTGGSTVVGSNEYIAKWDCEAGKRGDPLRIVERPPLAMPVNPPGVHTKPVEQDCIRVKQKRSIWRLFMPAYAFKPRLALARVRVMCRPAGSTGVYE